MRLLMILTTAIILNGCAPRVAIIGGMEDMLAVPKGSVISGIKVPMLDDQPHSLTVQKDSFLVSKDAVNRYQKARVG